MYRDKYVVWIIDDDEANRESLRKEIGKIETVTMTFTGGDILDLTLGAPRVTPDFIIIDLSAVGCGHPYEARMFYGPICTLCELHPGATILIMSQVSRHTADDTVERVKEYVDNVVEVVDSSTPAGIEAVKAKLSVLADY